MSQEKKPKNNTIWGESFTRIASFIVAGAILLAIGRYVYLKTTDQYPATFEEQDIIQHPHLEQLRSQQKQHKNDSITDEDSLQ